MSDDLEERKETDTEPKPPALPADPLAALKARDARFLDKNMTLNDQQRLLGLAEAVRQVAEETRRKNMEAQARKLKLPTLSVEEAAFGPQTSKTVKRKANRHHPGFKAEIRLDPATFMEAETQRLFPEPQKRVRMGRRKKGKLTDELLSARREEELDVQRRDWLTIERSKFEGTPEEAIEAITEAMAEAAITPQKIAEQITLASFTRTDTFTPKQKKERRKIEEAEQRKLQEQAEERQKKRDESMNAEQKQKAELAAKAVLECQLQWANWLQYSVNVVPGVSTPKPHLVQDAIKKHTQRQTDRMNAVQQLVHQLSEELHDTALQCIVQGTPCIDSGRLLYEAAAEAGEEKQLTHNHEMARKDAEGNPVVARHPPCARVYVELTFPPESVTEKLVPDWNPWDKHEVVSIDQLQEKIERCESKVANKKAEDPLDKEGKLRPLEDELRVFIHLKRELVDTPMQTHVLVLLTVGCDAIVPRPPHPALKKGAKYMSIVMRHDHHKDREYINKLGAFTKPALRCHADGNFILLGTPLRYGGHAVPEADAATLQIKWCKRADCGGVSFCSEQCKREHVRKCHPDTCAAKQQELKSATKKAKRAARLERQARLRHDVEDMMPPQEEEEKRDIAQAMAVPASSVTDPLA